VQRRPLADVFAPRSRILDFVGRDAREVISGDVTDAVAARLNRVHLHAREQLQDIRHRFELRPVELDVLARREMAVPLVVLARNARQHAYLRARQQAVGHGDAQHRRMTLNIKAVTQTQRAEVILRELPGKITARLVTELSDAFVDEPLIDLVVAIHRRECSPRYRGHEIAFGYVLIPKRADCPAGDGRTARRRSGRPSETAHLPSPDDGSPLSVTPSRLCMIGLVVVYCSGTFLLGLRWAATPKAANAAS